MAAAARRKKSTAPAAKVTVARPLTRSRATVSTSVKDSAEAFDFLKASEALEPSHVLSFYRVGEMEQGPTPIVREKSDIENTVNVKGFPCPYSVVHLADKQGIWQTDVGLVKDLGDDPRQERRTRVSVPVEQIPGLDNESQVSPAGLKNLGCTCYLNSYLQYLFFNAEFRTNLLAARTNSNVVGALQKVFALLAAGGQCTVDPLEFVTAAKLNAMEQADATEFSTLLLDWLQRELGQQCEESKGGDFIPGLFQGDVSQTLACAANPDHVFERREHFLELRARLTASASTATAPSKTAGVVVCDPNAADDSAVAEISGASNRPSKKSGGKKKMPTVNLEQLLEDTAFPEEQLEGSNQYHCPTCDCKVDARKATKLAKAPPCLHVTIERYHYDLHKGERRKLNHVVSFPRILRLRVDVPGKPATAEQIVSYQCVGYLEHVSDSVHSGHYTATLLQDASDVSDGVKLDGEGESKRARRDCTDTAATVSRSTFESSSEGMWWSLDDDRVAPVSWAPVQGARAPAVGKRTFAESSNRGAHGSSRIESHAAYMVLYRRVDHRPTQPCIGASPVALQSMPAELKGFLELANSKFMETCNKFETDAKLVERFIEHRRKAVEAFVAALRLMPSACARDPSTYCAVPLAWLNSFLRGKDHPIDERLLCPEGADEILPAPPPLYGKALIQSKDSTAVVLDPLSIWCGEVKLVPAAALDHLRGQGGVDSSLFLRLDSALSYETCQGVARCFRAWLRQHELIAEIVRTGRVSVADARVLHAQGAGDQLVWVSVRVLNSWKKIVSDCSATLPNTASAVQLQWKAFLDEAHAARWSGCSAVDVDAEAKDPDAEQPATVAAPSGAGADAETDEQVLLTSTLSTAGEVSLCGNLLCMHGLVCRPRCGALLRRAAVDNLLEASKAKEQAYLDLWPDALLVPRIRTGLPEGNTLGFDSLCGACQGSAQLGLAPIDQQLQILEETKAKSVARKKGGTAAATASTTEGAAFLSSVFRNVM